MLIPTLLIKSSIISYLREEGAKRHAFEKEEEEEKLIYFTGNYGLKYLSHTGLVSSQASSKAWTTSGGSGPPSHESRLERR